MTLPLWTLPLPIIAISLADWAVETYRKIAAGRSRPRRPLSRGRSGGDHSNVRVLRRRP